jgi:hypothetical protein
MLSTSLLFIVCVVVLYTVCTLRAYKLKQEEEDFQKEVHSIFLKHSQNGKSEY